ncbi:MAG: phosphotransferase [Planctomycetaceae bacterium]
MASIPLDELLRSNYGTAVSFDSVSRFENAGFSGAEIYRIQTGTGPFCLRRWPTGTMTAERLSEIHDVLDFLFQGGLKVVPVPIRAVSGRTFVEKNQTLWQLEPWMPGEATYHLHPSAEKLTSAMSTLARVHQLAEASCRSPGRVSTSLCTPRTIGERIQILIDTRSDFDQIHRAMLDDRDSRFRAVAQRIATHFEQSSRRVEAALRTASRLRVPVFPCLRDIRHDHLLFSEETLTGLVDFGALRVDTVAADLSRIAGSLFQSHWRDDPTHWNAALASYESVRPITDSERQLIPILDESGVLLSGTHWLRTRYVRRSSLNLPRICERLESIACRIEAGSRQN